MRMDNVIIQLSDSSIQLDEHLNVADGGLSELTLTFLDPSIDGSEKGRYKCLVPGNSGIVLELSIKVVTSTSR